MASVEADDIDDVLNRLYLYFWARSKRPDEGAHYGVRSMDISKMRATPPRPDFRDYDDDALMRDAMARREQLPAEPDIGRDDPDRRDDRRSDA
jgi:hypothetical protein